MEYTKEKLKEMINQIEKEEEEREMDRMISKDELEDLEVQTYPRKINEPFVRAKRPLWQVLLGVNRKKKMFNPNIKQPILQLIKDDGYTDWIEGVKAGLFKLHKKGETVERGIVLSPNKLTTFNMEPYPKMWIAYENESTPYPVEVYNSADELVSIVRKIEANRSLLKDEAKIINAKMMFWLAILGAGGFLLYMAISNGWFDKLFG